MNNPLVFSGVKARPFAIAATCSFGLAGFDFGPGANRLSRLGIGSWRFRCLVVTSGAQLIGIVDISFGPSDFGLISFNPALFTHGRLDLGAWHRL